MLSKHVLLVLLFVIFIVIFLMTNINFFTKTELFSGSKVGTNIITVSSDGTITLVPSKNVDTAINDTVTSLQTDTTKTFLKQADATKTFLKQADATKTFQPKGSYLQQNKAFSLSTVGRKTNSQPYFRDWKDRGGWARAPTDNNNSGFWIVNQPPGS